MPAPSTSRRASPAESPGNWTPHPQFTYAIIPSVDLTADKALKFIVELRRSFVMWAPLDPWASSDAFERNVDSFRDGGITESTVMWPPDDGLPLFERAAATIRHLHQRGAESAVSTTPEHSFDARPDGERLRRQLSPGKRE